MMNIHTTSIPTNPKPDMSFLDVVLTPLMAKGQIPEHTPDVGLAPQFHLENLKAFTIEREDGKWSAVIHVHDAPQGEPTEMVLTPTFPNATALDAFMNGALVLCALVTGLPELPFFRVGNDLMFATYGPAI